MSNTQAQELVDQALTLVENAHALLTTGGDVNEASGMIAQAIRHLQSVRITPEPVPSNLLPSRPSSMPATEAKRVVPSVHEIAERFAASAQAQTNPPTPEAIYEQAQKFCDLRNKKMGIAPTQRPY